MDNASAPDAPLPDTATFLLGTVGSVVAQRFGDDIAACDLKPKHVGLLVVLASGRPASQLEIAGALRVVPSLVVRLADHLERIGAIERARDPADRRRQVLSLTGHGRALLAQCAAATRSLEAELLAGIPPDDAAVLRRLLHQVGLNLGLPDVWSVEPSPSAGNLAYQAEPEVSPDPGRRGSGPRPDRTAAGASG